MNELDIFFVGIFFGISIQLLWDKFLIKIQNKTKNENI